MFSLLLRKWFWSGTTSEHAEKLFLIAIVYEITQEYGILYVGAVYEASRLRRGLIEAAS